MPRLILLACLLLGLLPHSPANGQDAERFYAGKRITYLVQGEPGTGYDLYARLIATYMERYLPRTRIRIRNEIMGGGGILMANSVATMAGDGLAMATLNAGLIYSQLQELDGIRFDLRELTWIGKAGADPRVLYTGNGSGITSMEALLAAPTPVLIATVAGVGTSSYTDAVLIASALGLDARMVIFANSGEANMSLLRGEVPLRIGSLSSAQRFVDSSGGHLLAGVGRSPILPAGLPDTYDYAVDSQGARIMELMEAVSAFVRFTVMPPGVPPERVALIRAAYGAALRDPELLAEAAQLGLPIDFMEAEPLQERINQVLTQPQSMIDLLKSTLGTR